MKSIIPGVDCQRVLDNGLVRRVDDQTRGKVAKQVVSLLSSGEIQLLVEASYLLDHIAEAVNHNNRPRRWKKILLKP